MADRFNYTVNENNFTVEIFDNEYPTGTEAPNIRQPHKPWGGDTAWDSKEEATAWAEETIAKLLNPPKPAKSVVIEGEVIDPVK